MDNQYKNTVISTRIRLARNINNLPFPNRLSNQEEIYSVLVRGVEKSCKEVFGSQYDSFQMNSINNIIANALVERHLISKDLKESEYGWAFINKSEDVSIMVNEEDHIRVQSIVNGFNLEAAYNTAAKVDKALKNNLDIAYDEKLGYLTACPTNLGSAMRASVMLFLPGLSRLGTIENVILQCKQAGMTIRGLYGEGSNADGYIYQVSNQAAVALSEDEIIKKVKVVVESMCKAEDKARERLKNEQNFELKNEIMISYGILKYCVKISSKEAMQNLAMVKLGVALGYIEEDVDTLNRLIVLIQPGMLCYIAKKELDPLTRDIDRASVIKNGLK